MASQRMLCWMAGQNGTNYPCVSNMVAFSGQQPCLERPGHVVAVNTSDEERSAPPGEIVLATHAGSGLPPHAGVIVSA